MTDWSDPNAVDRLLFDGEEVTADVPIGGRARVVVTTHRLLAFTPEGDGPNFAHADLPNVEGVERTASGRGWLLGIGSRAFVVGGILFAAGLTLDLDGVMGSVSTGEAGQIGAGGVFAMLDLLRTAMVLFDEVLLAGGALGLATGALAVGGHLATRERTLVIRVAGDDDIEVAGADLDSDRVERIERAVP